MTITLKGLLAAKSDKQKSIEFYQKRVDTFKTALAVVEKEIYDHYTFPSVEAARAVLGAEHEAQAHEDLKEGYLDYQYQSDFVVVGSDVVESIHTIATEDMYMRLAWNEVKLKFEHTVVDENVN